jgi:beta-galactosidase GanA
VSYDHRGFLIDSEPTLWIAGSMHYPRFTPGLWPNAMSLAKEMGMNAITSYVVRASLSLSP